MTSEESKYTDAQLLRIRAEEQLKSQQDGNAVPASEIDLQKLLHELQVHQVELEMQNEELRKTYETLEIALAKYTMLYEFAPIGYFTLDRDGNILELNFNGAEMLGERRISLVDSNFKLFLSQDSLLAFNQFLKLVFTGNLKVSCEVMLTDEKKSSVYIEGVVTRDDLNCLLVMIDISDRKVLHDN